MIIVEVTGDSGEVAAPHWLERAERVHRQLRPHLPAGYADKMKRVFGGGGRMCVAAEDEAVTGVAVYRVHENTVSGLHLYVDDLVVDEAKRSSGVGRALLGWLEGRARARGCASLQLDANVQNARGHRFYFREGLSVSSFKFRKAFS